MALKLLKIYDVKKFFFFVACFIIISCQEKTMINRQYLPIKNSLSSKEIYYIFEAKGGERHISLIDWGEDALPTSASSCHHGGEILPPQKGSIKAKTDFKNIYLDIFWDDKTQDAKTTLWDGKKKIWIDGKDDGIGIIFSKKPDFDCTTTCHMTSWEVGENKFTSDYKMFTKDNEAYPIVLIRAQKTENKPILALMDKNGKHTPFNKPIYKVNSDKYSTKELSLKIYQKILEDSKPIYPESNKLFILNQDNIFLDGYMEYKNRRWHAHITVPLDKIGYNMNNREEKIYIALAIFDNTHVNHSITKTFYGILE